MFGDRFFAARFFGNRYFGPGDDPVTPTGTPERRRRAAAFLFRRGR